MSSYNLLCHKNNFFSIADYTNKYFFDIQSNDYEIIEKKYTVLSGLLNVLWHEWSEFWRHYWLTLFIGGKTFNQEESRKITSKIDEYEVLYYIKALSSCSGKYNGCLNGSYQELTWGDIDKISDISFQLSKITEEVVENQMDFFDSLEDVSLIVKKLTTNGTLIANAISTFGEPIKHLQATRNAAIHLSKDNFYKIKTEVLPKYSLSTSDYCHPTEVIYASYKSQNIALVYWIDSMKAIIETVEENLNL